VATVIGLALRQAIPMRSRGPRCPPQCVGPPVLPVLGPCLRAARWVQGLTNGPTEAAVSLLVAGHPREPP
jgi:hypothetical protein